MAAGGPGLRELIGRGLGRGAAARPVLTGYDRNGRVELSAATTANWVAKTANLLTDELDLAPGAPVAVLAPAHWQTAVLLLGCWTAGVHVTADDADAAVVFADPTQAERATGDVIRLSLVPVGGAVDGIPDFADEVRAQPDEFHPTAPLAGDTPALTLPGEVRTTAQLAAAAAQAGQRWALTDTDRVLCGLGYDSITGVLAGLLTPLAAGGSVVLHPPDDALTGVAAAERVTATAGLSVPGLPRLDG